MTQDSNQQHLSRKKTASAGHWLYQLGIAFSAVLAFMQVVYDMGNRFVSRNAAETASEQQSRGLLKYEAPSFRIFGDMFVNNALALNAPPVGAMTGMTSTPVSPPPPGHR